MVIDNQFDPVGLETDIYSHSYWRARDDIRQKCTTIHVREVDIGVNRARIISLKLAEVVDTI